MPALLAGGVGVGATREEALRDALETWVSGIGGAIANAVMAKGESYRTSGFTVYAGLIGVRGAKPATLGEFRGALLHAVTPALSSEWPRGSLHTITLRLVGGPGETPDGEYRLDAQPSERLRDLVARLKWPQADGQYLLQQSFVVVRD